MLGKKTVRSYHFVVRFSQLGEWNSSSGASEPRYKLEVIYSKHIGSLGKVIEYLGGLGISQLHRFQSNSFESRTPLRIP